MTHSFYPDTKDTAAFSTILFPPESEIEFLELKIAKIRIRSFEIFF